MKLFNRFNMSYLMLGMAAVLGTQIVSVAKAARSIEEHWAETQIEQTDLLNPGILSENNCFTAFPQFEGCFDALTPLFSIRDEKAAGKKDEDRISVITQTEYEANKEEYTLLRGDFSGIAVVTQKAMKQPKSLSPKEMKTRSKSRITAASTAAQKLFAAYQQLGPKKGFAVFRSIIDFAIQEKGPLSRPIIAHAINTYLSHAYDPHTKILPANYMMDKKRTPDETIVGIGVELDMSSGQSLVAKVMHDQPAALAGIKRKDVILKVDSTELAPLTLEARIEAVRGPVDSKAVFVIQRGKEILNFQVTRKQVVLKNVELNGIGVDAVRMGHIKLRQFASMKDCFELRAYLKFLEEKGAQGVVLDLRGDPGGDTDVAMCILASFLDADQLLKNKQSLSYSVDLLTKERKEFADLTFLGSVDEWIAGEAIHNQASTVDFTKLPMTVLVSGGSASASEIVAGTLQHYQRAWVVGQTTFGKGTAQSGNIQEGWHGKQGIVFMQTKDRYYLPSGRSPQWVGVTPDFEVFAKPNMTEDDTLFLREADLFANSLTADSAAVSSVTRSKEIAAIKNGCLKNRNTTIAFEKSEASDGDLSDFELLYAQDVLWCEIQNTAVTK